MKEPLSVSKEKLMNMEEGAPPEATPSKVKVIREKRRSCRSLVEYVKLILYIEFALLVGWGFYSLWQSYRLQQDTEVTVADFISNLHPQIVVDSKSDREPTEIEGPSDIRDVKEGVQPTLKSDGLILKELESLIEADAATRKEAEDNYDDWYVKFDTTVRSVDDEEFISRLNGFSTEPAILDESDSSADETQLGSADESSDSLSDEDDDYETWRGKEQGNLIVWNVPWLWGIYNAKVNAESSSSEEDGGSALNSGAENSEEDETDDGDISETSDEDAKDFECDEMCESVISPRWKALQRLDKIEPNSESSEDDYGVGSRSDMSREILQRFSGMFGDASESDEEAFEELWKDFEGSDEQYRRLEDDDFSDEVSRKEVSSESGGENESEESGEGKDVDDIGRDAEDDSSGGANEYMLHWNVKDLKNSGYASDRRLNGHIEDESVDESDYQDSDEESESVEKSVRDLSSTMDSNEDVDWMKKESEVIEDANSSEQEQTTPNFSEETWFDRAALKTVNEDNPCSDYGLPCPSTDSAYGRLSSEYEKSVIGDPKSPYDYGSEYSIGTDPYLRNDGFRFRWAFSNGAEQADDQTSAEAESLKENSGKSSGPKNVALIRLMFGGSNAKFWSQLRNEMRDFYENAEADPWGLMFDADETAGFDDGTIGRDLTFPTWFEIENATKLSQILLPFLTMSDDLIRLHGDQALMARYMNNDFGSEETFRSNPNDDWEYIPPFYGRDSADRIRRAAINVPQDLEEPRIDPVMKIFLRNLRESAAKKVQEIPIEQPINDIDLQSFIHKMDVLAAHIDRLHQRYLDRNELNDDYISMELPVEDY